ncbi:MAG: hypothetical protein R3E10_12960 [Gemmatimonadota bacterium]
MERLSLIPLPFVPFPGTVIQLQLADERAREAFQDCADHGRALGFIFHDEARFGPFRFEEGGVGVSAEIRAVQGAESGGPRVIAQTTGRFVLVDSLVVAGLFLEVVAEPYVDEADQGEEIIQRREQTLQLFRSALRALPGARRALPRLDCQRDVSFRMAPSVGAGAGWKQRLLEMRDERRRLDRLDSVFLQTIARYRAPVVDRGPSDERDPEKPV